MLIKGDENKNADYHLKMTKPLCEYRAYISKEELNELPLFQHPNKIELIEDQKHALSVIPKIAEAKVLGFDIEIKPVFVRGQTNSVALLQLATDECTYLFRLNKIPLLQELKDIFTNESILKVGVAVRDDVKALQALSSFEPKGFYDIAKVVQEEGFESLGLRALVGIFLEQRLSKAAKITNWEKSPLTEAQILYAACDALAGLLIYQKMHDGV